MNYINITFCLTSKVRHFILVPFQAVQENEDDSAEIGSTGEISELLGDKEHLYPKILYLVIADSAYTEGKEALHYFLRLRSNIELHTRRTKLLFESIQPGTARLLSQFRAAKTNLEAKIYIIMQMFDFFVEFDSREDRRSTI